MKFYGSPQIIGRACVVGKDGEPKSLGDKIVTIIASKDDSNSFEGTITIDISDHPKPGQNLTVDVSLPELLAAIGVAAVNR